MDMTREKMLDEVMAVDFMLVDLQLFLNTHPYDQRALSIYMSYVQKSRWLRSNYERMYGPLKATASNTFPWPWIKSPWPWEWQ